MRKGGHRPHLLSGSQLLLELVRNLLSGRAEHVHEKRLDQEVPHSECSSNVELSSESDVRAESDHQALLASCRALCLPACAHCLGGVYVCVCVCARVCVCVYERERDPSRYDSFSVTPFCSQRYAYRSFTRGNVNRAVSFFSGIVESVHWFLHKFFEPG